MKKSFLIVGLFALLFFATISPGVVNSVTTTNCNDTDSGQNFTSLGAVVYLYNGLVKSATDVCQDSTWLVEYYCNSGSAFAVTHKCDYGCANGICKDSRISDSEESNTCTDPDGKNPYKKTTVTDGNGGSFTDFCSLNNQLTEYSCTAQGYVTQETVNCNSGCSDGMCLKPASCIKTGITAKDQYDNVFTDTCVSNSQVKEYYCEFNLVKNRTKDCDYGCSNGVCNQRNCSDTDGGKNYGLKGILTNLNNNYQYTDYCSSNNLIEYFCDPTSATFWGQERHTCTNGCSAGACMGESSCTPSWICGDWGTCTGGQHSKTCTQTNCPSQASTKTETESCAPTQTCTDSDNGANFNVAGTTVDSTGTSSDICSGSQLTEYSCNGTVKTSTTTTCQYGCSAGACNSAPVPRCTETDNGKNYYLYGSTTGLSAGSIYTFNDHCIAGTSELTEYYCQGDNALYENTNCALGCSNGACVAPSCTPSWNCGDWSACVAGQHTKTCTQTNCPSQDSTKTETESCISQTTCTDSDGGRVYTAKGTTIDSTGSYQDSCIAGMQVKEYYCDGNTAKFEQLYSCAYGCLDGACKSAPTCSKTGNGKDYFTKGTITNTFGQNSDDVCIGNTLTENYCENGTAKFESKNCDSSIGAYKCELGACVKSTASFCTDSDNGDSPDVAGTVTTQRDSFADSCVESGPNAGKLTEYYCSGINARYKLDTCAYGCSAGACNLPPNDGGGGGGDNSGGSGGSGGGSGVQVCTDPDFGKNYFYKSTTLAPSQAPQTDACNGNTLFEYYCDNNTITFEMHFCSTGCADGACSLPISGNGCGDTDGGKDYFTKGFVTANRNTGVDTCQGDYLTELYCQANGTNYSETKKCDFGCQDGACNRGVGFTLPVTTDNFQMTTNNTYDIAWNEQGYDGKNVSLDVFKFTFVNNQMINPVKVKSIKTIYGLMSSGTNNSWVNDLALTDNTHIYKFALTDLAGTGSGAILGYSKPFQVPSASQGYCGDRICNNGETTTTCPSDCVVASSHTECQNLKCVIISSVGTSQCVFGDDSTCIPSCSSCNNLSTSALCESLNQNCYVTTSGLSGCYSSSLDLFTSIYGVTWYKCSNNNACTDSDGGINYQRQGTVVDKNHNTRTDLCIGNMLYEYSCGSDGVVTPPQQYTCSGTCVLGACVGGSGPVCGNHVCESGETTSNCSTDCSSGGGGGGGSGGGGGNTCTDTDGGIVGMTAGTATDSAGSHPDTCNGKILTEYYCNGNTAVSTSISCDYCCNGKCVANQNECGNGSGGGGGGSTFSCDSDSDVTASYPDGKNYYQQGVVSDSKQDKTFTDNCGGAVDGSGTQLTEYYCDSNKKLQTTTVTCDCNKGACISSVCAPNWVCSTWSTCSNGQQTSTCAQSNCSSVASTKTETQPCSCYWTCSAWSACSKGFQFRSCNLNPGCPISMPSPRREFQFCK